MGSSGCCNFLIRSAHLLPNSPPSLRWKHSRRSSDSRWGQPSRMACKPSFVSLFPRSWRWCKSCIVAAIASASSLDSRQSQLYHQRSLNLNAFKRGQEAPTTCRAGSCDNKLFEISSSSSNGSFEATSLSPSFVMLKQLSSWRRLIPFELFKGSRWIC